MSKKPNELTIVEAARALRAREFSVRELWDACHAEAVARNPELNAYLEIFDADDTAIENAQKRIEKEGEKAPMLCGIPLAVKDNILIEGKTASAASRMLANYRATYDATIIAKLKAEGALFVGRTNMDEFALGGSTENSAFGPTKNPHDVTRVAGGTSGGSAAAVAAHTALGALGTDTGGSVRNPASYCGVVGIKPTYGAVSRNGLIAAVSSFDQAGPITKTVQDAEVLLATVRGKDPLDSTTVTEDTHEKKETPTHLRIGVPFALLEKGLDRDVREAFDASLARLESEGHSIVDVSLPTNAYALPSYYIINFAEVSTNLARYDGMRYGHTKHGSSLLADYIGARTEGFGKETKRRILLGTFVLSAGYIDAYYRKADAVRTLLRKEYAEAFTRVDVIATPTMPTPAFTIGAKADPLSLYLEDIFTVTANLTGMPAISVPMGTVEREGSWLPVGLHLTAPHGADELLLSVAARAVHEGV